MQLPQIISIKETGNPSFKKMVNTPWDTGVKPIENVVINPMIRPPRSARTGFLHHIPADGQGIHGTGQTGASVAILPTVHLLIFSSTIEPRYITYVPDCTHMAGSFVSSYGSPVCTFCHKTIKIYGLYHKHKG
jgi:hypothetical protein